MQNTRSDRLSSIPSRRQVREGSESLVRERLGRLHYKGSASGGDKAVQI